MNELFDELARLVDEYGNAEFNLGQLYNFADRKSAIHEAEDAKYRLMRAIEKIVDKQ